MADVAEAANTIATAIRGIAPPPPAAAPQSVSLTPFTGAVTEDFRVFREQLESSIAPAQVPKAQQVGFLKLHLQGGARNYFLELPAASKNTLNNALLSLENRYLSANRVELYKLKFQERKFNQSKETPEDFLTDITRLANIAFADSGGNDYSAERTRRIRDAFISGMPTHIRLKLLMQPETTTVNDLCASVSKRLTLKSILPDEDAQATGFNSITDNSTSSLATALNNIATANKNLASSQRELGRQMNKMQISVDRSNNRGFHRGNFRGRRQIQFNSNRGNNRPSNHQGYQRQQFGHTGSGFYNQRGRDHRYSPIICRNCGQPGHIQSQCWFKPVPQRGTHVPFATIPKN